MSALVLPPANEPFVAALRSIVETEGTWSVIGGFAVWCHLGESHRPTLDIDAAASERAHETLVSLGAPGTDSKGRIVEGVKLEVIEVDDPGEEAERLDEKNRLFVTGHWGAAKRGGDGLDIVRLLETADWDEVVSDARSIDGLSSSLVWAGQTILVDQAARVARLIAVETDSPAPPPDHVRELGQLLLDQV